MRLESSTDCLLLCRPQEPDDEEQRQVQDTRSKYRRRLSSDSESDAKSRRSRSGKLRKTKGRAGREDDAPDDLLPAGEHVVDRPAACGRQVCSVW